MATAANRFLGIMETKRTQIEEHVCSNYSGLCEGVIVGGLYAYVFARDVIYKDTESEVTGEEQQRRPVHYKVY
jgi:hypothetical protein